ncbi:hypothetical protein LZ31DRAFT_303898 [Colletotrichum somersetense]|nr:hypothetical protein LZ31DRAFT_303898 [Colletotrichum somersetense]
MLNRRPQGSLGCEVSIKLLPGFTVSTDQAAAVPVRIGAAFYRQSTKKSGSCYSLLPLSRYPASPALSSGLRSVRLQAAARESEKGKRCCTGQTKIRVSKLSQCPGPKGQAGTQVGSPCALCTPAAPGLVPRDITTRKFLALILFVLAINSRVYAMEHLQSLLAPDLISQP